MVNIKILHNLNKVNANFPPFVVAKSAITFFSKYLIDSCENKKILLIQAKISCMNELKLHLLQKIDCKYGIY